MHKHPTIWLTGLLLAAAALPAQEPPSQEGPAAAAQERPGARPPAEPEIRPYEKVITKEAKTERGLFTVHRIKSKVYYEIPKAELGKDFLWVAKVARTPGVGYGGMSVGNRVVRWQRIDKRVLLRNVSYEVVADKNNPISLAVQSSNNNTIIMSFFIEALGKDDAPVIDVTRLFTTEVAEFSPRATLRARRRPQLPGADQGLPGQHRGRGIAHLHLADRAAQPECALAGAAARAFALRDGHAARQRHRAHALQHGRAAGMTSGSATSTSASTTTRSTSTARHGAPTSPAGGWRRRTPARPSPSR